MNAGCGARYGFVDANRSLLGTYRLCWHAANESALPYDAGVLRLSTLEGALLCTLGEPCELAVPDLDWRAVDPVWGSAFLLGDEACDGNASAEWLGVDMPFRANRSRAAPETFPVGTPRWGRVGDYAACWGWNGADFLTPLAGAFTLLGPALQNFTCVLGLPCTLPVRGLGLALSNARPAPAARAQERTMHGRRKVLQAMLREHRRAFSASH